MNVVIGIEGLATEIQILQRLDRSDSSPRVLAIPLPRMAASPRSVEILQSHIGHLQGQHTLDLLAQVLITRVFEQPDQRRHVLYMITGRIVFVVAKASRAFDHSEDPPSRLTSHRFWRTAIPHVRRVGPTLGGQ